MNAEEIKELIMELSRTVGISGSEDEAAVAVSRYLERYTSQIWRDRLGNLIAFKGGQNDGAEPFSLALVAHLDEIGAMVTRIEEGGALRFTGVGGIDPRILPGQPVQVHGKTVLKGVIGAKAPHLLTVKERREELKFEDLFIDLGLSREQAEMQVRIGDLVSFDASPVAMVAGNSLAGKSLDNRAGVAALVICAAELAAVCHRANLYFVASVQEEVGLRGAITAAYGLVPDLAVAIDVTHGEAPGLAPPDVFELGGGPVISVGPNYHPALTRRLEEVASADRFAVQREADPASPGTDAWVIQVSREGIPCALLSIPLRYMHTTVEMLNLDDLTNTGRLLASFARSLDRPFVEGLACF
ncbi:MAG TPA: M42 family metallopeptidase [Bacillota bacterium]|nr:M42 family metallopeptidase [Bacillota bacterium]HPZ41792.1 M42 family metallopeptidase [Bacillota bacterium]